MSLSYRKPNVIERIPVLGLIHLGGLGSLGVGTMWFHEQDYHREYPGYDTAIQRAAVFGPHVESCAGIQEWARCSCGMVPDGTTPEVVQCFGVLCSS